MKKRQKKILIISLIILAVIILGIVAYDYFFSRSIFFSPIMYSYKVKCIVSDAIVVGTGALYADGTRGMENYFLFSNNLPLSSNGMPLKAVYYSSGNYYFIKNENIIPTCIKIGKIDNPLLKLGFSENSCSQLTEQNYIDALNGIQTLINHGGCS